MSIKCNHQYTRSMDQEYPRKCVKCGAPEEQKQNHTRKPGYYWIKIRQYGPRGADGHEPRLDDKWTIGIWDGKDFEEFNEIYHEHEVIEIDEHPIARAPELEAENLRLKEIIKEVLETENQRLREALGKIPEGAKWFTFEMFRKQLMDFALAYHKSTQKDIANDSSEWAYEIFDKDDSATLSSSNQKPNV